MLPPFAAISSAATPVACGAAIEVPWAQPQPLAIVLSTPSKTYALRVRNPTEQGSV